MNKTIMIILALSFCGVLNAQKVGIGTSTPNAALEVQSTTDGFLPPRLTIAQRNAISNPAIGLLIFCTDCDDLEVYNGTVWKSIGGSAGCVTSTLPSVTIGSQVWTTKNLDVANYRNGDPIPQITDPTAWQNATTGAWCWYNNDSATYAAAYGRLYNWFAVTDPRGLAPLGWHVPSDAEWTTLSTYLGGDAISGGKMKETGTIHWVAPNTGATNSSGFTGRAGGFRSGFGVFTNMGYYGSFWSSTEFVPYNDFHRRLNYDGPSLNSYTTYSSAGLSVRCVKD